MPRIDKKSLKGRRAAGDLLVMAARNADQESVRDLVKWGIPVDSRNSAGQTPLIAAVLEKSPDVVGYLLKHKTDEGLTYEGRSAREIAHALSDPELTKEFMSISGSTIIDKAHLCSWIRGLSTSLPNLHAGSGLRCYAMETTSPMVTPVCRNTLH